MALAYLYPSKLQLMMDAFCSQRASPFTLALNPVSSSFSRILWTLVPCSPVANTPLLDQLTNSTVQTPKQKSKLTNKTQTLQRMIIDLQCPSFLSPLD